LVKADDYIPSADGHKIYFTCDDVNHELAIAEKIGATIILPKMSIGEFGNMALLMDTEGNMIGLHSNN
jgi:uncharacterized protein